MAPGNSDDMPDVPKPEDEKPKKKSSMRQYLEKRRAKREVKKLAKAAKRAARKPEDTPERPKRQLLQGILKTLHNPLGNKSRLKALADEERLEKEMIQEEGAKVSDKHHKEAERRAKKLLKQKVKKKQRTRRTALHRRRMLAQLLLKAGYEQKAEQLQRIVFYLAFIIISAFTLATLITGALWGKKATDLLIFYSGLWTGVFAFVYLFIWLIIYVFLDLRIYRRTRELEEVLPDFLQLASANISAGMPVDRALWFSIRPNFGVLAKEIEEVAKATLAGEELHESLLKFTERYDSMILKRSINILLEGIAAGGEIADLLNKIALNIQETKILRKEMSANVATYAIFITFASIVMAPFLFALATQLLTIIVSITSNLNLGGASNDFLTLNVETTPDMISNFQWFSVMMLSISALMSASIVSVIRRGRVKEGIRNLPIFIAVSLTLYYFGSLLLKMMFSGFF